MGAAGRSASQSAAPVGRLAEAATAWAARARVTAAAEEEARVGTLEAVEVKAAATWAAVGRDWVSQVAATVAAPTVAEGEMGVGFLEKEGALGSAAASAKGLAATMAAALVVAARAETAAGLAAAAMEPQR